MNEENPNIFNQILETSREVTEKSKHVKINEKELENFINKSDWQIKSHWLSTNPYEIYNLPIKDLVNFLIIYDSICFSFWGNPKWQIKTETKEIDGAIALIYALLKLRKKECHLNFEKITYDEFKESLKGNTEIPFQEERYQIVKEISKTINQNMNGDFYEYTKDITTDIDLINLILKKFPSYEDKRTFGGKTIYFYKLAQLTVSDILRMREKKEKRKMDYSHLVGCSDYKIPQILRALNILEYDETLSNIVDEEIIIKENDELEVEIRANTIVVIDKIKKKLKNKITAIEINDYIWNLSQQNKENLKPYHKTRTTNY